MYFDYTFSHVQVTGRTLRIPGSRSPKPSTRVPFTAFIRHATFMGAFFSYPSTSFEVDAAASKADLCQDLEQGSQSLGRLLQSIPHASGISLASSSLLS